MFQTLNILLSALISDTVYQCRRRINLVSTYQCSHYWLLACIIYISVTMLFTFASQGINCILFPWLCLYTSSLLCKCWKTEFYKKKAWEVGLAPGSGQSCFSHAQHKVNVIDVRALDSGDANYEHTSHHYHQQQQQLASYEKLRLRCGVPVLVIWQR